jgi:thioredoxin-related protein
MRPFYPDEDQNGSFFVSFEDKLTKRDMTRQIAAIILFLATSTFVQAQDEGVRWMTFEEAVERSKHEKRTIFIDVYTDWCGWCKVMDRKTFSDPAVAKLLNEAYYPVKFNAEQREDVEFKGTTFKYVAYGGRGVHQLAAALLQNELSYPSVVFLNEDFAIIHIMKGFQQAPDFHKIASYIGGGHYKDARIEEWEKEYRSPFAMAP